MKKFSYIEAINLLLPISSIFFDDLANLFVDVFLSKPNDKTSLWFLFRQTNGLEYDPQQG
jgi:hypothetical protein